MAGHLLRRPEVFCDLQAISARFARGSPERALRFLQAVEDTLEFLRENPTLGGVIPDEQLSSLGFRIWRVKGFRDVLIFYRLLDSNLEIVRIIPGRTSWRAALAETLDSPEGW